MGFAYLVMKAGRQVDESRVAAGDANPGTEHTSGFHPPGSNSGIGSLCARPFHIPQVLRTYIIRNLTAFEQPFLLCAPHRPSRHRSTIRHSFFFRWFRRAYFLVTAVFLLAFVLRCVCSFRACFRRRSACLWRITYDRGSGPARCLSSRRTRPPR